MISGTKRQSAYTVLEVFSNRSYTLTEVSHSVTIYFDKLCSVNRSFVVLAVGVGAVHGLSEISIIQLTGRSQDK